MKLGSTLSPKFFGTYQLCSARVTRDYRVLGVLANDIVIWFWIGPHDNYERLIRELR